MNMIKICSVVKNNEAVTVFDYDGVLVQIPSIHKDVDSLKVKYEDGMYSIVSEDISNIVEDNGTKKNKKNKKQLD